MNFQEAKNNLGEKVSKPFKAFFFLSSSLSNLTRYLTIESGLWHDQSSKLHYYHVCPKTTNYVNNTGSPKPLDQYCWSLNIEASVS